MARHRTPEEKRELAERARQLRAAGRSRRQIQAELGIGDDLAKAFLRGVPLPDALARPRAKDADREAAVALRAAGLTYDEIAAELGVSKSTCSLWLRDLPRPEADPAAAASAQERRVAALRARARSDREARELEGRRLSAAAAESLAAITSRDLVLALAVSYWCEGAKRKPWAKNRSVQWMNSDPMLVTLFLEGLDLLGIARDRLVLRLQIHEAADEVAAREWWAGHTGVPLEQFRRSTIKRHNPRTVRHNVGSSYRGCLAISVLRARDLYDVLEGLVTGLSALPRWVEEWHDEPSLTPSNDASVTPSALV